MNKYPLVNFRSPSIYLFSLLMLIILIFCVLVIVRSDNFWLSELFLIPVFFVLLLFIYSITGKVIVDYTTITRKTIFGSRSIRVDEVQKILVMRMEGELGIRLIDESEFDSIDWIFPKTIFLSGDKDFNPMSRGHNKAIKFHFQKDLYEDILLRLKSCKSS